MTYADHGRCRSGQSWFWYAAALDYDYPRCADPVCEPGLHPHEYGWEDAEDLAVKAMADAHPDRGGTNEGFIAAREAYERALRQAS